MAGQVDEKGDYSAPISAINVTPFVDVVLVLLVIFIVTAPTIMKDAMNIRLPKANSGDRSTKKTLGVAITKQGQILINGTIATEEILVEQVQSALNDNPDIQALIAADKDSKHGDLVHVIDLIRGSGLNNFGIEIEH